MNKTEGVHWLELTGKNWWQVEIQDVIAQDQSIFSGETNKAIIDSGTSLITVPYKDFVALASSYTSKFVENVEYICYLDYKICLFLGKCASVAPRLDPIYL